jgi:hypothetical protein
MKLAKPSLALLISLSLPVFAVRSNAQTGFHQPVVPARDRHSTNADLTVPLCSSAFIYSAEETAENGAKNSNGISRPIPTSQPAAEPSDEARHLQKGKKRVLSFDVMLGLVVDATGKPGQVCLMRSAGYGLDANAAKAAEGYHFEPGMKGGKPVAVPTLVEVSFHLN